ncbi:MAG: SPRY domain-containing protein, partial [bacterium]
ECTILGNGIVRLGLSTSDASLDLGTDGLGFGYGGTGKKVHANNFEHYGFDDSVAQEFRKNDVVGCLLDFSHHQEKGAFQIFNKHLPLLLLVLRLLRQIALFPLD